MYLVEDQNQQNQVQEPWRTPEELRRATPEENVSCLHPEEEEDEAAGSSSGSTGPQVLSQQVQLEPEPSH